MQIIGTTNKYVFLFYNLIIFLSLVMINRREISYGNDSDGHLSLLVVLSWVAILLLKAAEFFVSVSPRRCLQVFSTVVMVSIMLALAFMD